MTILSLMHLKKIDLNMSTYQHGFLLDVLFVRFMQDRGISKSAFADHSFSLARQLQFILGCRFKTVYSINWESWYGTLPR
jgi:hypothetical protein